MLILIVATAVQEREGEITISALSSAYNLSYIGVVVVAVEVLG